MARYIDADKLCEALKSMASVQYPDKQSTILGVVSSIENFPTADVVPKSEQPDDHHKQVACYTLGCREGDKIRREVAREIFEEIEEEINAALKNNYARRSECNAETDLSHAANISGKIACLRGLADFVEELKKKYTEGKDEQAPTRDPI